MPEVTDLMRVAQWAKSSGSPSDVYNAACRLLEQPDGLERLQALLEGVHHTMREEVLARGKAEATIERVKEVRDGWYARPHMSDQADALDVALDGPESNRGGRTPQTQGAAEGQEAREAQGVAQ